MKNHPNYKWYILILTALTGAFAIAAPFMSMSVLFGEISAELQLDLGQVGLIWGIGSLPGFFSSLLVGAVIDRFGPKRVILWAILLLAMAGAARGLAGSFPFLLGAVLVFGMLAPAISTSSFKICSLWFPSRQLGLANGVFAMGMALGFFLSALLSANVLSVWLGGWRQVMFFYGGVAALLCIPWIFAASAPKASESGTSVAFNIPMRQALSHVVRLRNVWLLGITLMGMSGCMQGLTGYLPTYLRSVGWPGTQADGALSLFHAMSMGFVLPFAMLSDRLKVRKPLLVVMVAVHVLGGGLLSVANGPLVWGVVMLMGLVRDGSMAVVTAMIIESPGVGPVYAGSATGFSFSLLAIANLLSPSLGNRLAESAPALPFAFWAGLAGMGLLALLFVNQPQPKPELLYGQSR